MSGKPSYAVQKIIERAVKAAKDAGLDVGGVEVLPDGTVRVLTRESAKTDAFADWQKRRGVA
jgi:hypothetical protein